MDHHGRALARIFSVVLAVWVMGGVAFAQVTPPLIATLRERVPTIDGACISGGTIQTTIRTGQPGNDIRLGDVSCVSGRFSVDVKAIPLLDAYQVVAVQIVNGTASAPLVVDVDKSDGPFGDERFDFESNAYIGLAIDTFVIDPTNYIHFNQHVYWAAGRQYLNVLDLRAQTFETLQGIERSSVDYYAGLRNLYRQNRAKEIRNGKPAGAADLPDF